MYKGREDERHTRHNLQFIAIKVSKNISNCISLVSNQPTSSIKQIPLWNNEAQASAPWKQSRIIYFLAFSSLLLFSYLKLSMKSSKSQVNKKTNQKNKNLPVFFFQNDQLTSDVTNKQVQKIIVVCVRCQRPDSSMHFTDQRNVSIVQYNSE